MSIRLLLVGLAMCAAFPALGNHVAGTAQLDGVPVILFSDYTWAHGDLGERICTDIEAKIHVCANKKQWPLRFGSVGGDDSYLFGHDSKLSGEIKLLRHTAVRDATEEDVLAYIGNNTLTNGRTALQIFKEATFASGKPAITRAFDAGGRVLTATYTALGKDMLVAITTESNTTLYTADHKATHKSFLEAIEIEE